MIFLTVLAWLSMITGSYMLLFTLANIFYMRRVSGPGPSSYSEVTVSVLIPARNESGRIAPTLAALMKQEYSDFEVIVLDDNSEDGTRQTVQEATEGDSRFRCVSGKPLPPEWKGKPYAMQQLIAEARGEILIFIDADMRPEPDLIAWTVSKMKEHDVDFLSGYARHTTPEKAEYLLFPVMYLATSFLLPLWLFRHVRSYMFSHAIGQFFCVRATVMQQTGGFEPVKDKINEDIQMARHLKGQGFSQVFLDAKEHISGNMYDSMDHARMGVMRVVYEYFDNLVYPFLFMGLVMIACLLAPIPLFPILLCTAPETALLFGLNILLVLAAWLITMRDRKLPWYTALFYPIHFSWTIWLSIRSIVLSRRGRGYRWKGRIVRS